MESSSGSCSLLSGPFEWLEAPYGLDGWAALLRPASRMLQSGRPDPALIEVQQLVSALSLAEGAKMPSEFAAALYNLGGRCLQQAGLLPEAQQGHHLALKAGRQQSRYACKRLATLALERGDPQTAVTALNLWGALLHTPALALDGHPSPHPDRDRELLIVLQTLAQATIEENWPRVALAQQERTELDPTDF